MINLINGTVSGNVYGGGYGISTETKKGLVNSNPIVNVGDTTAAHTSGVVHVEGDVLGGGALAQVVGNTKVNILKGTVDGSVFGGGEGLETNPVIALVMKRRAVSTVAARWPPWAITTPMRMPISQNLVHLALAIPLSLLAVVPWVPMC